MEIPHGRKRVLEGEEECALTASSVSCGAGIPRPCLFRPGRQKNRVFHSPGSPRFVLVDQDWLGWRIGPG